MGLVRQSSSRMAAAVSLSWCMSWSGRIFSSHRLVTLSWRVRYECRRTRLGLSGGWLGSSSSGSPSMASARSSASIALAMVTLMPSLLARMLSLSSPADSRSFCTEPVCPARFRKRNMLPRRLPWLLAGRRLESPPLWEDLASGFPVPSASSSSVYSTSPKSTTPSGSATASASLPSSFAIKPSSGKSGDDELRLLPWLSLVVIPVDLRPCLGLATPMRRE
mmetsp:Transcript_879/g.2850  ORF Transcript_879/g.2850 Transcript_879/m.2850 type:complete len:221 (-) Transcript_879:1018-1680(-)